MASRNEELPLGAAPSANGHAAAPTQEPVPRDAPPEDEVVALRRRLQEVEDANTGLREHIQLLETVRERLSQLTDNLNRTYRLTQEINTLDIDKIIHVCIEKVPLLVDAKHVSLFFYNPKTDELVLKGHNHPYEIHRRVVVRRNPNSIMGVAVQTREVLLVGDIEEFERTRGIRLNRSFAEKYVTKSCVCVPLLAGRAVVAVLNLSEKVGDGCFDELNDLPPLVQLAHILGVAIQNCMLFREIDRQARTDGLTHLHNYRSFYENLKREIHRAVRYRRNLSFLMTDVDGFKKINDTYGHPVGDRVLAGIAQEITAYIRREDVAARLGGDEFALLLPETPLKGAAVVAERIRDLINAHDFEVSDPQFRVALSYGVVEFREGMTLGDFVKSADEALYAAKAAGKNRIVTGAWTPHPVPAPAAASASGSAPSAESATAPASPGSPAVEPSPPPPDAPPPASPNS
ncbi:MAG: sensor domain-containing diguanylate cyclase [Planctomycetes bacterium]|nr:sensor domain-containing diguanylate cyclase [Planctomycetota bacterium]